MEPLGAEWAPSLAAAGPMPATVAPTTVVRPIAPMVRERRYWERRALLQPRCGHGGWGRTWVTSVDIGVHFLDFSTAS